MNQMKGGISRRLSSLRQALIDISALLELELDFSEEDVEFADRSRLISLATDIYDELRRLHSTFSHGNAIKEGIPVAIAGATNAGKSSLLNALLQDDRAIVSDIHGTTRDTVEETLEIGDYLFRFIDTAGLRETTDEIERIGIRKSHEAIGHARILMLVIDPTQPLSDIHLSPIYDAKAEHAIIVINKSDIVSEDVIKDVIDKIEHTSSLYKYDIVTLSAKSGDGIGRLTNLLTTRMDEDTAAGTDNIITNLRQATALVTAAESTAALISALKSTLPTDLVAEHLRETLHHLSTITGTIPSTEILNTIFSRFCIGK